MEPPAAPDPTDPRQGERGIAHLARLARLELEPGEVEGLAEHLRRMIAWVAELEAVDLQGPVEDASQAVSTGDLRPDVVQPSLAPEQALAAAPARAADGGFAVPTVIPGAEA